MKTRGMFFQKELLATRILSFVFTVLSNDFSHVVGQTYYFMYQQKELVFYALFVEVI